MLVREFVCALELCHSSRQSAKRRFLSNAAHGSCRRQKSSHPLQSVRSPQYFVRTHRAPLALDKRSGQPMDMAGARVLPSLAIGLLCPQKCCHRLPKQDLYPTSHLPAWAWQHLCTQWSSNSARYLRAWVASAPAAGLLSKPGCLHLARYC